jgi:hypothetical protein
VRQTPPASQITVETILSQQVTLFVQLLYERNGRGELIQFKHVEAR